MEKSKSTGKSRVMLSAEQRRTLERVLIDETPGSKFFNRACILLAADENRCGGGLRDRQISSIYQIGERNIQRVKRRFRTDGFESALNGRPHYSAGSKKFDERVESRLTALLRQPPPPGNGAWTLRAIAGEMMNRGIVKSISHESVRQLLIRIGLSSRSASFDRDKTITIKQSYDGSGCR